MRKITKHILPALACVMACGAAAQTAGGKVTPKPVKIDQPSWGNTTAEEASAVAMSVAQTFAKFGSVTTEDKIHVYESSDPWPIALTSFQNGGRIIKVVGRAIGNDWAEFIYQFGHEFCHQFCRHYNAGYDHSNMWFQETLCELAAQWALAKVGDEWAAGNAPFSDLKAKGAGLKNYGPYQNRHCPTFKNPKEFRDWIEPRLAAAYKESKPDNFNFNKTVALYLFPLFIKEPGIWETVPYLNVGIRKDDDFAAHLKQWYNATPARIRHHVARVAAHVGYPIAGAVTIVNPATAPKPELKEIRMGQSHWMPNGDSAIARTVCENVGAAFLKSGNVAAEEAVVVKQTTDSESYTPHGAEDGGTRLIYVTAAGADWPKLAYEFSREYCNVFSRHWEAPIKNKNQWFYESLADAAGLWGVAMTGFGAGAVGGNEEYQRFFTGHMNGVPQFSGGTDFAAWLKPSVWYMRGNPKSGFNRIVAGQLLQTFKRNPAYWQAVAYLNVNQEDPDDDFQTLLNNWYGAVPTSLRPAVSGIAASMGFGVK